MTATWSRACSVRLIKSFICTSHSLWRVQPLSLRHIKTYLRSTMTSLCVCVCVCVRLKRDNKLIVAKVSAGGNPLKIINWGVLSLSLVALSGKTWLTLSAHTHEGYSTHFVCLCVCVCLQSADAITDLYRLLNTTIGFLQNFFTYGFL